jgi:hypothetical protein
MMSRKARTVSDMSVGVGGNRKGRGARPPDGLVRNWRVVNGPVLRILARHGLYHVLQIVRRGKPELRYVRAIREGASK